MFYWQQTMVSQLDLMKIKLDQPAEKQRESPAYECRLKMIM